MKPSRIVLTLCLVALCASPVLAEGAGETAEPDPLLELFFEESGAEGSDSEAISSDYFEIEMEQGGCSNGQIRELQTWCGQKADVMSGSGHGNCTSKGIHYCYADSSGNVTDYSCAISCS